MEMRSWNAKVILKIILKRKTLIYYGSEMALIKSDAFEEIQLDIKRWKASRLILTEANVQVIHVNFCHGEDIYDIFY